MNAFTSTKPLVDTSAYRKSANAKKGGELRAQALGGAAVHWLKGTHDPSRREIKGEKERKQRQR